MKFRTLLVPLVLACMIGVPRAGRAEGDPPAVSSVKKLDQAMLEKELASYPAIDFKTLKSTLAEARGKKVAFDAAFQGTYANPPDYMERAGVRPDRYTYIRLEEKGFIVVAKHTDDLDAVVATLKHGMKLRIYGEVQKFSVEPKGDKLPLYFVDAAHLVIIPTPPVGKDGKERK